MEIPAAEGLQPGDIRHAITVRGDRDWRALCRAIGREDLLADPASAILEISRDPAVIARQREIGAEPRPLGPAEFEAFIRAENEKWREVVRLSGAKLD